MAAYIDFNINIMNSLNAAKRRKDRDTGTYEDWFYFSCVIQTNIIIFYCQNVTVLIFPERFSSISFTVLQKDLLITPTF